MLNCRLMIRDTISLGRPFTDADLNRLDCFYQSPLFHWDGSLTALNTIIDHLQKNFYHFIDWEAELIVAEA